MNEKLWKGFAAVCALALFPCGPGRRAAVRGEGKTDAVHVRRGLEYSLGGVGRHGQSADGATQETHGQGHRGRHHCGLWQRCDLGLPGDGITHDDWWSAMSVAGVLNVLDQEE